MSGLSVSPVAAVKANATAAGAGSPSHDLKTRGNSAFQCGHFTEALQLYSEALELEATAVLFSNRAACHLKLEAFGSAIADATEGIKLNPDYIKSYYRRGSAKLALSKFKDARKDFLAVARKKPKDRDARAKLTECDRRIKKQAFEEAIASERGVPLSERLDLASIVVPPSYTGAAFDGDITQEFVDQMVAEFKDQRRLHKHYAMKILLAVKKIFDATPSLMTIDIPETWPSGAQGGISVCGDTHGQYYDLLNIFAINGCPGPENPYLFNGDYVDRGSFSVENVLTLFAYKVLYPGSLFLTRGNHETKNMNQMYGFTGEVKAKFDDQVMELFAEVFNSLPLAAAINGKVFVVHGGLFQRDDVTLAEVAAIPRGREPPESGIMSDLMWSDPQPFPGRSPSKRGVGQSFGPDVTAKFLARNGLELLIRSHEVKDEGYLVEHDGKCITVFSAPNYCLAEDMQLLTDAGFMSLDAFVAAYNGGKGSVRVAGFDPAAAALVYETPRRLVLNAPKPGSVVDFTPGGADWWQGGTSLRVTPEHQMFAAAGRQPYAKRRADAIAASPAGITFSMPAAAGGGVAGAGGGSPFVAALGLTSGSQVEAFLQLYGAFVGRGHVSPAGGVVIPHPDVVALLAACGVVGTPLSAACAEVTDAAWVALFAGHPAGGVLPWCWSLPAPSMRCVLRGLAPGGSLPAAVPVATPALRDTVVRAALHAGLSAACAPAKAGWAVTLSATTEVSMAVADVKTLPYAGRTWCVTMPSGFIWVRRVATAGDGSVTHASTPVVVCNCDQMGNKGAIIKLGYDMKPKFVQFEAVEHPPSRPMQYAGPMGMFGL